MSERMTIDEAVDDFRRIGEKLKTMYDDPRSEHLRDEIVAQMETLNDAKLNFSRWLAGAIWKKRSDAAYAHAHPRFGFGIKPAVHRFDASRRSRPAGIYD